MNCINCRFFSFAFLGAVLCCGCNRSEFSTVPVSGHVTFEGKPLADATVLFLPIASGENPNAGPSSRGKTNAEGRFVLNTQEKSKRIGAVPAEHRVSVTTCQTSYDVNTEKTTMLSEERIPAPYNNISRTPLRVTVPAAGTDSAEVVIEAK